MNSLQNILVSNWGYVTWAIGAIVALLMWASQVTLKEAISNLSSWPPQLTMMLMWLLNFLARKWSIRTLFGVLLTLSFLTGYWYGERSNPPSPPLPPEKIYIPTPPIGPQVPKQLVANLPPALPRDVAQAIARYMKINDLVAQTRSSMSGIKTYGSQVRDQLKRPNTPIDPLSIHLEQQRLWAQYEDALRALKDANDKAYTNRPLDLDTVPELAIPTMTAPGEEAFAGTDGKTQYEYRAAHFKMQNAVKGAESLLYDLEKEKAEIRKKLTTDETGANFLHSEK